MKFKLKDLCEVKNGYAFKSDNYTNSGIRVIRITNVQKGFIEDERPEFYPLSYEIELHDYMLYENDLLLSLTGNVGRVALLSNEFLPAALNQRVACIRVKNNKVLNKYLFYYLLSNKFENNCIKYSKGIAQKNMSTEWLKEYELDIVSINEQNSIICIFDKLYRVINKYKIQLNHLDTLIKARFVEMFGDPISNSKNYKLKKLIELGELGRGVSKHRPRNDPKLLGGKYPLIQTGDVANADTYIKSYSNTYSEMGLKQSKMWKEGTLCITIAANIASTAIMLFDACFPDSVVGFNANDEVDNTYIHYWFTFFQSILEKQAPAVAQKNINLQILSELKVIVPNKSDVESFAAFVKKVDKLKFDVQKSLEKTQMLFDSLMQKYFD